jgi:hypothetical protein
MKQLNSPKIGADCLSENRIRNKLRASYSEQTTQNSSSYPAGRFAITVSQIAVRVLWSLLAKDKISRLQVIESLSRLRPALRARPLGIEG